MNILQAAKLLGGEPVSRNGVICPGPGHSPRDRSLSVRFTPDGFRVFSHSGDNWKTCKDHVRDRLGLKGFENEAPRPAVVSICQEDTNRSWRAGAIWREARPISGTPAERYLAGRSVSYRGEDLRWHSACPFGKERRGCMVALVRNIVTNAHQAIHRTALDQSGNKLSELGSNGRLSFGPIKGGAVKLTEDAEASTCLAIAEGIETALSIRELPDLENMPVWSLLSAGGVAAFPALAGLEAVWIGADNDASGTGEKAAEAAAERLTAKNITTIILMPAQAGEDLNDKVKANA